MKINEQIAGRLMLYYHNIMSHFNGPDTKVINSTQIAYPLSAERTQVHEDLAAIGIKNHVNTGYSRKELIISIRKVLGFDRQNYGCVIGAGRLGSYLACSADFQQYGLYIEALFDTDPHKVGLFVGKHIIQPMEHLKSIITERQLSVAILATNDEIAQMTAIYLIASGIENIWNYTQVNLDVPDQVQVKNEYLSAGWAQLSYRMANSAS